jgi:DNA-binding transcriptional MerR regulator
MGGFIMEPKEIISREYTTPEIASILGKSTRKVISMLERGYFKPSIKDADGHASRRLYSFDDVVRAYITMELLEFGVSVKHMRSISLLLQHYLVAPFFMINKHGDICEVSADTETNNEDMLDFLHDSASERIDKDGLPDSSPVLYIPVQEMRAILAKRIQKIP